MIDAKLLAYVAFTAVCLVLLSLPFIPAYREWKYPSDSVALPVFVNYENDIDHFAKRLHADATAKLGLGSVTGYEDFNFVTIPAQNMQWSNSQKRLISTNSIETMMPICSPQPLYMQGSLKTGSDSVFSALYATGDIELGTRSKILNWAHADGAVRLGENSTALKRISSGSRIVLGDGAWFERLSAPSVQFSTNTPRNQKPTEVSAVEARLADVPNAIQQTPSLYYVKGDCELVADSIYHGSLIVTGRLIIGYRTTLIGNIKTHKDILLREGASVQGAVTCEKFIHLFADTSVLGPLFSERDIVIGANAVIGRAEAPTSVNARNILVDPGAVVHGSIWAHEIGMVRSI